MALLEHVKAVLSAPEGLEYLRLRLPKSKLDLSGADLSGRDLSGIDLSGADLSRAKLDGVSLERARLCSCDLTDARLGGARCQDIDLSEAKLERMLARGTNFYGARMANASAELADFGGATLAGSDLSRGDFRGASFNSCDLTDAEFFNAAVEGASFTGADVRGAVFVGVRFNKVFFEECIFGSTTFSFSSLRGAMALDKARHYGRSALDLETLLSAELPLAFARGVGLPDVMIDYLPSLLATPIQFFSCFISYSAKDSSFAKRLHADLQANGVRCWFAPEDMKIGDTIRDRIDQSIKVFDKLLIILSEHSATSQWVEKEIETAFEEERKRGTTVLFPIRIDETAMSSERAWVADIRRQRHIGDFSRWRDHDSYQVAFERLLRDLRGAGVHTALQLAGSSFLEDDIPF